ncbi:MAG: hypothetical protein AAF531_24755 [Actinomycetota bacterium]
MPASAYRPQPAYQPQPPPPQAQTPQRSSPGCLGGVKWGALGAFLLAAVALAYGIGRGQDVRSVDPTSGRIEFYSTGGEDGTDIAQIEARQGELSNRLETLEQQARTGADQGSVPATTADFTGTWSGANGLTYVITQFGTMAVIEERSVYGTTATGEGTVFGDTAEFTYVAYDGSFGRALLTLVSDAEITGTFFNDTYGLSSPAFMTRS